MHRDRRSQMHRSRPNQGRLRRLIVSGTGGAFDGYDRCIEIGESQMHRFHPHQGRLRRLFVSGTGGAFDSYDRCIEIGDLRCIALVRIKGGFAAFYRLGYWWCIRPLWQMYRDDDHQIGVHTWGDAGGLSKRTRPGGCNCAAAFPANRPIPNGRSANPPT
jgi:hypothetical protein